MTGVMAVLHRAAITCHAFSVLSRWRFSLKVMSRTQWGWFSMPQWSWSRTATCSTK